MTTQVDPNQNQDPNKGNANPQNGTSSQQVQNGNTGQTFTPEQISKLVQEQVDSRTAVMVDKLLKENKGASPEEIEKRVRAGIVKAITGEKEPEKDNPIHVTLAKDPVGFVNGIIDLAKKSIRDEDTRTNAENRKIHDAYLSVVGERPDIKDSKDDNELFLTYYYQAQPELSEEDKFKWALNKYDSLVESKTGKKSEDRVKAALGISASGNFPSSSNSKESERDILAREQKARVQARRKALNRDIVITDE